MPQLLDVLIAGALAVADRPLSAREIVDELAARGAAVELGEVERWLGSSREARQVDAGSSPTWSAAPQARAGRTTAGTDAAAPRAEAAPDHDDGAAPGSAGEPRLDLVLPDPDLTSMRREFEWTHGWLSPAQLPAFDAYVDSLRGSTAERVRTLTGPGAVRFRSPTRDRIEAEQALRAFVDPQLAGRCSELVAREGLTAPLRAAVARGADERATGASLRSLAEIIGSGQTLRHRSSRDRAWFRRAPAWELELLAGLAGLPTGPGAPAKLLLPSDAVPSLTPPGTPPTARWVRVPVDRLVVVREEAAEELAKRTRYREFGEVARDRVRNVAGTLANARAVPRRRAPARPVIVPSRSERQEGAARRIPAGSRAPSRDGSWESRSCPACGSTATAYCRCN